VGSPPPPTNFTNFSISLRRRQCTVFVMLGRGAAYADCMLHILCSICDVREGAAYAGSIIFYTIRILCSICDVKGDTSLTSVQVILETPCFSKRGVLHTFSRNSSPSFSIDAST